jgi:histidine racemase
VQDRSPRIFIKINFMGIKKLLIAGGNSTALVYDLPSKDRGKILKTLLNEVEQVGFVNTKINPTQFRMMGGELSINGTLACAYRLGGRGKLIVSGLSEPVIYANRAGLTSIKIPLKFKQNKNIIVFEGIGFVLYKAGYKRKVDKKELIKLTRKYKLPAFGGVIYDRNKIIPYVYVSEVGSYVRETACGSGSITLSLFTGVKEVIQTTNKKIFIEKQKEYLKISAKVTEIK